MIGTWDYVKIFHLCGNFFIPCSVSHFCIITINKRDSDLRTALCYLFIHDNYQDDLISPSYSIWICFPVLWCLKDYSLICYLLYRCLKSEGEIEKLQSKLMDARRKLDDTTAAMQELGRENQSLQVFYFMLNDSNW